MKIGSDKFYENIEPTKNYMFYLSIKSVAFCGLFLFFLIRSIMSDYSILTTIIFLGVTILFAVIGSICIIKYNFWTKVLSAKEKEDYTALYKLFNIDKTDE